MVSKLWESISNKILNCSQEKKKATLQNFHLSNSNMINFNIKVRDFDPLENHLKARMSFETLLFSELFIPLICSSTAGHCACMAHQDLCRT